MERLASSPLPAKVCPNCDGYYLGIRCESCKWTEEWEGCHPCHGTGKNHDETARCEYCGGSGATRTMLADDDEASSADDTDFEPTQPDEEQP